MLAWPDADGGRTTRVVTRRLAVTRSAAAAVEALDPEVAAVVWAKAAVAQALERGAAGDRKEAEILKRQLG